MLFFFIRKFLFGLSRRVGGPRASLMRRVTRALEAGASLLIGCLGERDFFFLSQSLSPKQPPSLLPFNFEHLTLRATGVATTSRAAAVPAYVPCCGATTHHASRFTHARRAFPAASGLPRRGRSRCRAATGGVERVQHMMISFSSAHNKGWAFC